MAIGTMTECVEQRLTVKEAAETAKVHTGTINRWMKDGTLAFTRTGTGRIRIKEEDLKTVLAIQD